MFDNDDSHLVPLETDPLVEGPFILEYSQILGDLEDARDRLRKLHEVILLATNEDQEQLFQRLDEEEKRFNESKEELNVLKQQNSEPSTGFSMVKFHHVNAAIDELFEQINELSTFLSLYQQPAQRCLELGNNAIMTLTQQGKYNTIHFLSRLLIKLQSLLDELNMAQKTNEARKRSLNDAKGRLHELEMYLKGVAEQEGGQAIELPPLVSGMKQIFEEVTKMEEEVSSQKKNHERYWQLLSTVSNSHEMYRMLRFVARMSVKKAWSKDVVNDLAEKIEALELALQSSLMKSS